MYGSDVAIYPDACFCDVCWEKFSQTTQQGVATTIAKEQRFAELVQRELLQYYVNFQQEQLQAILAAIEQQVHSINPNLWLGFLAYMDNWFYRGLIGGLGTTTRPVLVFSETTYIRGYTPAVMAEKKAIEGTIKGRSLEAQKFRNSEAQMPISRYIPGLWLGRFFPEDLPAQAYSLAVHTAGYWIFTAYSLWTDEQKTGHYTLHGDSQNYWLAFKQANDELQRFSQAPETYQSNLPPIHLSSFYDTSQNRLITQPALKSLLHDLSTSRLPESIRRQASQTQNTPEFMSRGQTLWHCLKNPFLRLPKGEGTTIGVIRITHIPPETYSEPTSYKLFDHNGVLFQEGVLDNHTRSTEIALPANISGVVSLLIDSSVNLTKVAFVELPFVIEASSIFHVAAVNPVQRYAFYVGSEKPRVKLRAYCSSYENPAVITIQSPDRKIIAQSSIKELTEINIPIPVQSNKPGFWTISVSAGPFKLDKDMQFYLYDEEFPYVIPID